MTVDSMPQRALGLIVRPAIASCVNNQALPPPPPPPLPTASAVRPEPTHTEPQVRCSRSRWYRRASGARSRAPPGPCSCEIRPARVAGARLEPRRDLVTLVELHIETSKTISSVGAGPHDVLLLELDLQRLHLADTEVDVIPVAPRFFAWRRPVRADVDACPSTSAAPTAPRAASPRDRKRARARRARSITRMSRGSSTAAGSEDAPSDPAAGLPSAFAVPDCLRHSGAPACRVL